jgi:single-stranded DNA-binding protein
MNRCFFIVRLSEEPNQKNYNAKIGLLNIKANFVYKKKKKLQTKEFNLLVWGNQKENLLKYYRKDDYVLIEGFLRTFFETNIKSVAIKEKKIEIIVLRIDLLFPTF